MQVGEAGELAECFQWKGEVPCGLPGFSNAERQHVGEHQAGGQMLAGSEAVLQFTRRWHVAGCMQNFGSSAGQAVKSTACCNAFGFLLFNKSTCAGEELADVLLYLVRLSDACGIDLAAAAEAKLRKNAGKFLQELGKACGSCSCGDCCATTVVFELGFACTEA